MTWSFPPRDHMRTSESVHLYHSIGDALFSTPHLTHRGWLSRKNSACLTVRLNAPLLWLIPSSQIHDVDHVSKHSQRRHLSQGLKRAVRGEGTGINKGCFYPWPANLRAVSAGRFSLSTRVRGHESHRSVIQHKVSPLQGLRYSSAVGTENWSVIPEC